MAASISDKGPVSRYSPVEPDEELSSIPKPVLQAISEQMDRLKGTTIHLGAGSAFSKIKIPTSYEFGVEFTLSLNTLIEVLLEEDRVVDLLDLGCGNGLILSKMMERFPERFRCLGFDIKTPTYIPESHFVKGDIHTPVGLAGYRFDLIVSKATFRHLIDPKAALVQAYDRLKPGGFLIIDQILLPGMAGYEKSFVDDLNKRGYPTIVESIQAGSFHTLIIQKTHDHLDLPMEYHADSPLSFGFARYQPNNLGKSAEELAPEAAKERLAEIFGIAL